MSNSVKVERVDELPIDYNANVIFELPPTDTMLLPMDGMEQCSNQCSNQWSNAELV